LRFHPSEEQNAIVASVGGTVAAVMNDERLAQFVDGDDEIDRTSWDALMVLGCGGLLLPENLGGAGLGLIDVAMVIEALGAAAVPGPIVQHLLATLAVAWGAKDALVSSLDDMIAGKVVATLAFGAGWMPEEWTLEFAGDRICGTVDFVPGGSVADRFVVGISGGGLCLVNAGDHVHRTALASSDRTRRAASVTFDNSPARMLLAPGDLRAVRIADAAIVLTAADALGGAERCLDMAVRYAGERQQFGQQIGRFQALKHQLADMAVTVESARALMWYAAHAWDTQLDDARHAAAIAKAHIADCFVTVARAAVEAHGAIGYTWDYGLSVRFRRSLFDFAYLGTPSLHRGRAADLSGW
jgi:alkylation response protein AidB-like acyl-CoA dehydrogenase